MRAVAFDTFGGPEVLSLRELPRPEPQQGEVLVKVAAATVNPTDLVMRSGGQVSAMKGLAPPFVAGMELAGQVEA